MIERVLGTSAKVSATRVLVLNPSRPFSLNELAAAAGCSPSTMHKQIGDLFGAIAERGPEGIRLLTDSPMRVPLRNLFLVERRLEGKRSVFDALAGLGGYYVTGASALYLRGLGRDFSPMPRSYLIVCDRAVAKSRGMIHFNFPKSKLRLVEDKVYASDFEEISAPLPSLKADHLPVAVPERAVADSLWRIADERADISAVVYVILEQVIDLDLVKKYVRRRGTLVEDRLRWVLNEINRVSRRKVFSLKGLRSGNPDIPDYLRREIQGAIDRVLGS